MSAVDNMVETYEKIGLDDSYSRCIKQFASLQSGGQYISGGAGSPLPSLFGELAGLGGGNGNSDMVSELLGNFLGGNFGRMNGLNRSNTDFLDETVDGDTYSITGRVPAMLNGERVELILMFDNENPCGYIAGARTDYEGATDTVAKGLIELQPGDELDFLCDYYSYDGEFWDNYYLGETMIVTEDMEISNVDIGSGDVQATFRLTDIYNQHYWTEVIE